MGLGLPEIIPCKPGFIWFLDPIFFGPIFSFSSSGNKPLTCNKVDSSIIQLQGII